MVFCIKHRPFLVLIFSSLLLSAVSAAPTLLTLIIPTGSLSSRQQPDVRSAAYGRDECPSKGTIIGKLIMYNILGLLSVLLIGHRKISRRIWCTKGPYGDPQTTIDWGLMGMYLSLGWNIGFTYLSAVVTRPPGTDDRVWEYFQLWAIQPRATPLIALLGYARGYTGAALSAFVVDAILCIVAVQFQGSVLIMEGKFESDTGSWPIYRVGAVMAIVPLVLCVILGLGFLLILCCGGVCLVFGHALLCCCRLCPGEREDVKTDNSFEWETKEYGWYTLYMLFQLIMYIGRWMMWSGFPPELYCPTMSGRIDLIWGLGPFGEQLAVSLFNVVFGG